MGWASGGVVLQEVVKQFKKLFPDLRKNKKALKALVEVRDRLEDMDYDCFDEDYAADTELWDKALRAAGKKVEADDRAELEREREEDE
jgi:hypothetical protein